MTVTMPVTVNAVATTPGGTRSCWMPTSATGSEKRARHNVAVMQNRAIELEVNRDHSRWAQARTCATRYSVTAAMDWCRMLCWKSRCQPGRPSNPASDEGAGVVDG
jgi:hypothetical protein